MKLNKNCLLAVALMLGVCTAEAAPVRVTMNATSPTMSLSRMGESSPVSIGDPSGSVYNFDVAPGTYTLTAFGTNGTTQNGTIELIVKEGNNEFSVLTCTAYVNNTNADGTAWTVADGDYTLDVTVNSREGVNRNVTYGDSETAGRNTFLAFIGDSYQVFFNSSETHFAGGFGYLFLTGTLTSGVSISGAVPKAIEYTVSAPTDAIMQIGFKTGHYVDFKQLKPVKTTAKAGITEYTYLLNTGQQYNYRTMHKGGLTLAGIFTANSDITLNNVLNFTDADYATHQPTDINHSNVANEGYETGNIFVNINEKGYKRMSVGEKFNAHAMRNWELTNSTTGNYFIEPDFHYTVLDLDGNPSQDVLKVEAAPGSAWATISAQKKGTAIVLVTYDAIQTNQWSGKTKSGFVGGEFWGAIWPENTAAYVISVDEAESTVKPQFLINKGKNQTDCKNSGDNVDAELDVFYYLDSEPGCKYTFTAEGASSVTVAYPTIGENMATYTGFTADGITRNDDGSYTVLLKQGRQIVRITDSNGNSTYQVLTAKPCKREIVNVTRPGAKLFLPGEKIKVRYSGLQHPANKLAGIHNFSATVSHNGAKSSTANQYTYGNDSQAQAIELTIPSNSSSSFTINNGSIYVTNYGDPLGNYRFTGRTSGRSANFTAVLQTSYLGQLPDAVISISEKPNFDIVVKSNIADAKITVKYNGVTVTPNSETGLYSGTLGNYSIDASKDGYRQFHAIYTIGEDAVGAQEFSVTFEELNGAWDGKTQTEPKLNDKNAYIITNGAELAWFANIVNTGGANQNAILAKDIHLGNFTWTPIGNSSSKCFKGTFDGAGHEIAGLYINTTTANQGLFGYAKGTATDNRARISGITVRGFVQGGNATGGILGYSHNYVDIDRCANYADIESSATSRTTGSGGIIGTMYYNTATISNCFNAGSVKCATNHGGIVGYLPSNVKTISNVYNIGEIIGDTYANACFGNATSTLSSTSAYAVKHASGNTLGYKLVTEEQMASGEIAYVLGEAFGQLIGKDSHPILGGTKVLYNPDTDKYYNENIETGISNTSKEDVVAIEFYNLRGERSDHSWKGINIVRFSDGSVRKVFVK